MNAFEKWGIWVASLLVGLTGVAYFWTRYLLENPDPFSIVNHPLEPWLLKAHIVTAPLLVLALGSILVRHVWKHYRLGIVLGRKSGLTMGVILVPMVLSGYLIQALTDPLRLGLAAWGHIGFSALYLAALAVHQIVVHRRRAGRSSAEADDIELQAELLRARAGR